MYLLSVVCDVRSTSRFDERTRSTKRLVEYVSLLTINKCNGIKVRVKGARK